ncbi:MAG TPA: hypothetical protein VL295_06260 [Gemmatimonadales bacterium]|nr:hypothetical protein [Gemmatimonadales bacterium]
MSARLRGLWLLLAAGCALPEPVTLVSGDLVAVSSHDERTCGLDTEGVISCWGLEGTKNVLQPSPLAMPLTFRALAREGTCALPKIGDPICWTGVTGTDYWTLVGAPRLESITVGDFPCGTTADGSIWCWLADSDTATQITTGPTLTGLEVGAIACGLDSGGFAKCFGGILSATPVAVQPSIAWKQFVPMHGWACGIRTTDSLVCFTFSPVLTYGPLNTISTAPITDGSKYVTISGQENRATFLSDGGRAYSKTLVAANVTPEASGVDWLSLTNGRGHTCGQLATGQFACYGENSNGQLGDGTTNYRTGAVLIGGGAP